MTGPLIPPGAGVDPGTDAANREDAGVMPGEPLPDEEDTRRNASDPGPEGAP
jgi:hypothetical protein